MMLLLLFIIATGVSTIGTLAGFGGGIFLVPIMVIGMHIPIQIAIGVTACALFFSSLNSTMFNLRKGLINFKLAVLLEIPTVIGAILGAKLTTVLSAQSLKTAFGLFLIYLAAKILKPSEPNSLIAKLFATLNKQKPSWWIANSHVSLWSAGLFGLFSGIIAGLFGIGGGILKTPIMLNVFKVPIKIATATALCMIVFTSLSSGITHWYLNHVKFDLLATCASGFLIGSFIGNLINVKLSDQILKIIIATAVALAGIVVFGHSLIK